MLAGTFVPIEEYILKIGFIGLGNMGSASARNIARGGHTLVVHDINRDAASAFLAQGAQWADTPAQVMDAADIVFTMVFGPADIDQVVRGTQGFLSTSCKGKAWIDMTTSSPQLMRELGAAFAAAGGLPVDSPVTGSIDSAIRGDMILFVGGSEAAIALVSPVLELVGVIRRVGAYGNGYVAKLVNNQLWLIHAAAIGEAMVTAKLAGLEPAVWWAAMKGGAAESFVMQHDVPSIFAGHYDPSFRLELCLKDLGLIADLVAHTGTRNELTSATHQRFAEAQSRYGKDAGEMTVCKVLEDDAGIELRVAGDWTPPWEVRHPSEA